MSFLLEALLAGGLIAGMVIHLLFIICNAPTYDREYFVVLRDLTSLKDFSGAPLDTEFFLQIGAYVGVVAAFYWTELHLLTTAFLLIPIWLICIHNYSKSWIAMYDEIMEEVYNEGKHLEI